MLEGWQWPYPQVAWQLVGNVSATFRQLFGSFSATLAFFSNFRLVEELSVYRATFKFSCLNSHSHAPATSEKTRKCRIQLLSRIYLLNLLVLLLGSTCFNEKMSLRNKKLLLRKTGRLSFKC